MKHDEKKIEEIVRKILSYLVVVDTEGIGFKGIENELKQYAEHMVEQEREMIEERIKEYNRYSKMIRFIIELAIWVIVGLVVTIFLDYLGFSEYQQGAWTIVSVVLFQRSLID